MKMFSYQRDSGKLTNFRVIESKLHHLENIKTPAGYQIFPNLIFVIYKTDRIMINLVGVLHKKWDTYM